MFGGPNGGNHSGAGRGHQAAAGFGLAAGCSFGGEGDEGSNLQGDVHLVFLKSVIELGVEFVEKFTGGDVWAGLGINGGDSRSHIKRGRDALPANIANGDAQLVEFSREEVK